MDLFESLSKTLFRVLFSSLYLQIRIFYHGILDLQWCGRRPCWSLFNKRISLTSFEFGTNVFHCLLILKGLIGSQEFPFLVRLWARDELIPSGNTTSKRQNNATFVTYDSGNASTRFYRSSASIRVSLTSSRLQAIQTIITVQATCLYAGPISQ
jgi:hypothetical protein